MAQDRHTLRQIVVQTIFAWEFHDGDPVQILSYNLVNGAPSVTDNTFGYRLLDLVMKNRKKIKEKIAKHAPEWPFEKIAPIDRAILELSVAELLFDKEIPDLVAINEGIELAKEFGTESSPKFVNGVLSSIYEKVKPA
ncbi:transcription antitermination factor NusB [Patescibacteria group bacterium]|nr:transcription antitermination factor NusB [Patescibacteria group bacterium]